METCLLSVDEHGGFIVHSSEVEQHVFSIPRTRDGEVCPEPGIKCVRSLDTYRRLARLELISEEDITPTREAAFEAGRNQDFLGEILAEWRVLTVIEAGSTLILPNAVQVLPLGSLHLRARILGPRIDSDIIGPRGGQWRLLRSILNSRPGGVLVWFPDTPRE